ncbi:hypothetical protein O5623_06645 [Escherichia coli]|nr:hypothetical protein [Escherichia coli]
MGGVGAQTVNGIELIEVGVILQVTSRGHPELSKLGLTSTRWLKGRMTRKTGI